MSTYERWCPHCKHEFTNDLLQQRLPCPKCKKQFVTGDFDGLSNQDAKKINQAFQKVWTDAFK